MGVQILMGYGLTNEEINYWWYLKNEISELATLQTSSDVVEKLNSQLLVIQKELDTHFVDPYISLLKAMKTNRIVMFGERHFSHNPQRWFLAGSMLGLKEAGATHLAIEQSILIQPQLDKFMKTNELDPNTFSEICQSEDYLVMLKAAHNSGLKIVATDLDKQTKNALARLSAFDYASNRDKFIADQIDKILALDPNNKVVWQGGSAHGIKHKSEQGLEPAALILQKAHAVFTVRDAPLGHVVMKTTQPKRASNKSIAILTKDSPLVSSLRAYHPDEISNWESLETDYGKWDMIILHPRSICEFANSLTSETQRDFV